MSIDVDTLISDLRDHLGVDSGDPGWDNTGCLRVLNRSLWELLNKFNFREKETSYSFSSIVGTRDYIVPGDFEALKLISIEDLLTFKHTPLARTDITVYERDYVNSTDFYGKPTKYLRYNNFIRLQATPDNVYNLTVYNLLTLQDLQSGGSVDIPREWDELILQGGVYRGYKILGDYTRAMLARRDQADLVDSTVPVESKEENDSPLSGLDVAGYDPYNY